MLQYFRTLSCWVADWAAVHSDLRGTLPWLAPGGAAVLALVFVFLKRRDSPMSFAMAWVKRARLIGLGLVMAVGVLGCCLWLWARSSVPAFLPDPPAGEEMPDPIIMSTGAADMAPVPNAACAEVRKLSNFDLLLSFLSPSCLVIFRGSRGAHRTGFAVEERISSVEATRRAGSQQLARLESRITDKQGNLRTLSVGTMLKHEADGLTCHVDATDVNAQTGEIKILSSKTPLGFAVGRGANLVQRRLAFDGSHMKLLVFFLSSKEDAEPVSNTEKEFEFAINPVELVSAEVAIGPSLDNLKGRITVFSKYWGRKW